MIASLAGQAAEGAPPLGPVPLWAAAPFVALLLAIASGPVAFPKLWHHHYPKISLGLGALVAAYYLVFRNAGGRGAHALLEAGIDYFAFVALLCALFVVSAGILVHVKGSGSTTVNLAILGFGGALASVVGTTGASMLLIRPYLRVNREHFGAHHLVFFIFIVANAGGALTPIGDPPLFLGYLLGIPFFWTADHLSLDWFSTMGALLLAFAAFDAWHGRGRPKPEGEQLVRLELGGFRNFAFLAGVLMLVLVQNEPFLQRFHPWSKAAAAAAMLALAGASYALSDRRIHKENQFTLEPMREVALLFAGIFATMIPALEYLSQNANALGVRSPLQFYFATGLLSAFLDNAPTYVTFLTTSLAQSGRHVGSPAEVLAHVEDPATATTVAAISAAAVFFGAMTYIGNGPNLMVRSITESAGFKCPSFFGYLLRWAVPVLLPILVVLGWLFYGAFAT